MTTRTRAEPDRVESSDLHLCLPVPCYFLFLFICQFSKRCCGAWTDCGIYDTSTLPTVLMLLLAPAFLLDGCSDCYFPSLMTLYLLPGAHSGSRLLVPPHTNIHNKAKLIYPFLEIPPSRINCRYLCLLRDLVFYPRRNQYFMTGKSDHDALEGGTPPPGECMGHSLAYFPCLPAWR